MWANMHLLFWLSLVPFVTGWMGENHFATLPVALYGFVLLMAGVAYFILAQALAAHHGRDSKLAQALGKDVKGMTSVLIYAAAIAVASWSPAIAGSLYVVVAIMWLIPDRRMEKALGG
jgi:uncharacterized membrane protein